MIIRIMGEGQWRLDDDSLESLNPLDAALESALEGGAEDAFRSALHDLLEAVRRQGTPLADDELLDSDLILPPPDASGDDVRELLGNEGLIPG